MEALSKEMQEKVNYCLNCKVKPCSNKGCPLNNDIPTFIRLVKEGNMEEAYYTLLKTSILGSVCGRICPHYKQCMGSCVRGIKGESVQIGDIEAYISDYGLEHDLIKNIEKTEELKGKNIAVIGGGPAGLTASYFLAKAGANVTIYEKHNNLGGILEHGIPEFRLDPKVLDKTIKAILSLGINVKYNVEVMTNNDLKIIENNDQEIIDKKTNNDQEIIDKKTNRDQRVIDEKTNEELKEQEKTKISIESIASKYDATILAIGANVSSKMNIPGEDLQGVYGGNELLENKNYPDFKGKVVAVSGGGNVAMDTARTVARLGAKKVFVIYRRAEEQMPAEKKEIEDAKKEGIEFLFQNNIVKILGDKKVEEIECIRTKLVQKEGETRLSPVNIEGSNYRMRMDSVIMAVGSKPEEKDIAGFEKNKWGYVNTDEEKKTSIKNVYAIGDIAGNKATVAWAARSGRDVAFEIIERLK